MSHATVKTLVRTVMGTLKRSDYPLISGVIIYYVGLTWSNTVQIPSWEVLMRVFAK